MVSPFEILKRIEGREDLWIENACDLSISLFVLQGRKEQVETS
jgi:hypothetical protein